MHAVRLSQLSQLDPTAWSSQATSGNGFWMLLSNMLDRAPYYLGGLALLALLYSGAMYVMAMGDASKMETAKKNITWVVIGIIAVASVAAVLAVIGWLANPRV